MTATVTVVATEHWHLNGRDARLQGARRNAI